jgi:hypothetical protein
LQNNILLPSSDESFFVNKLLRDTPTAYHDTTTLVNQASATSGSINNKVSSSNTSNLPSFSKPLEPRKKTKPTNSSSSCDYSFDDTPISKSNSTSSDDCNQMMTQILEMQKTLHMLSDANVKLRAEIDNSKKEQQQNSSMEEKSSASSRKRTFMSMRDNYQSAEEPEQLFSSSSNQPTSHYWQHYHSGNNDEPAFPTTGAPSFPNLSDTNNYRRHQESRNDRRAGFLERQHRCFSFYYLSQLLHL